MRHYYERTAAMHTITHTMKRLGRTVMTCCIASAVLLGFSACGQQTIEKPQEKPKAIAPIAVVSTVDTWGSLAQEIGGNDIKVDSIMTGANSDITAFKPHTQDLQNMQNAQVVITNGAGYDDWATKTHPKKAEIISAAATVGALNGDNPYFWFSHDAREAMASAMADTFSKVRPNKKNVFNQRLAQWQQREKKLTTVLSDFSKEYGNAQYASTSPILFWLMSDLNVKDSTPKEYADAVSNNNEPQHSSIEEFQKLIEDRKVDVLISDSQQGNDILNLLNGIAGRSYTSTVRVSELMPKYANRLDQWIMKICDDLQNALQATKDMRKDIDEQESQKKPITKKPNVAKNTDPKNSNEGQQDPGK